ncbi:mechanosensitive ion channel family protein [uncultured Tateyamaria sp.]|uniref:mechanosensitive ion channel family protein n=1 Tax=uncultured Tateyamaria sp. TaxID=455651 RepID=UPI002614C004|nr:mechanosensitive ion channel family protein [uncultured Tateyamaria sp.]
MRTLSNLLLAMLVTLAVAWVNPASAQSLVTTGSTTEDPGVTLPDPLTPEAANALISRLSDTQVRDLLLDQLNTQAAEDVEDEDVSQLFYHSTAGAFASITTSIERLPILFSSQAKAFSNFASFLGVDGLARTFGFLLLSVAGGIAAELLFRRITSAWLVLPKEMPENSGLAQNVILLVKRLTSEIAAVGVFVLAAYLITYYLVPPFYRPFIGTVGPLLIGLPRLAIAVSRFLMAPNNPAYRLVHATDATAKAMVFHMFWFVFLIGFSTFIVRFNAANGVPVGESRLGFWLNLGIHLYAAIVIWRYREASVMMMRGADPDVSPVEERIARAFPFFGVFVALGTWWIVNIVASTGNFALLAGSPHYKTMGLLLFAPAMDTLIRGLVRHLAPPMTGEGPIAERAYASTRRSYIRIGRVIVFGIVLITIANFWGMSPSSIASAGVGERFAGNVIEFLMILSIGYLVYEVVSLWINRKLAAEQTAAGYDPENEEMGGGDGGGAGGSRLSTVLPLILGVSRAAIIILFLLLGLGNIGIDTTPLLAGAGIVGLAIGFGAQKLVSDVVSGIFFLVDDAFRTGEYVEVDGTMGTVEKISIRSMQLRHHRGPVHTLPYGEIPKITNYSRDWVIMKLRFTVPFGTDPNKVKKIFKSIGAEMLDDPLFKDDFLQPFKSQGVLEFDDVGIVMRGKFMAKPGTQFTIRKELLTRVNKKFEEAGIDFARREVRVAIPNLDEHDKLTDDEKIAIAAAASQAAQEVVEEAPGGSKPGD